MRYALFNIGCIECGCPSGLVGLFDTKEQAEDVERQCDAFLNWRNGGQNGFEIFELPRTSGVTPGYASELASKGVDQA